MLSVRGNPTSRSRRGFTLTELIVALVAMACVAAIAIPAFFERSEVTLENAAVLLARDLRTAQNRAAYMGQDVRFEFDEDGGGYHVTPGPGDDAYLIERRYGRDAVFRGVRIDEVRLDGDVLVYLPLGYPRQRALIVLHYESDERVVVVEANTGRLTILGTTSGFTDDGY